MSGSKDADGSEATENTINQQHYIGSNERDNVKKKIMLSIITTSYTINNQREITMIKCIRTEHYKLSKYS